MAQLDEGSVLGGRYLITAHVMTSSEQDVVLHGLDQVLNREVMILVAGPEHNTQVATSARELATGQRQSTVQILDLGLTEDHTYLIAADTADAQDLLSLLVDNSAASSHEQGQRPYYVEPFYTENLGSEIFGVARSMEPQTYSDDAEYYEELNQDVQFARNAQSHRPKFLNRLSDRLTESVEAAEEEPDLISPGEVSAAANAQPKVTEYVDDPEPIQQTQPIIPAGNKTPKPASDKVGFDALTTPSSNANDVTYNTSGQNHGQNAVDDYADYENAELEDGYVYEDSDEERSSGFARWIAAAVLLIVLVGAVIFAFNYLGGGADRNLIADGNDQNNTDTVGDPNAGQPSASPSPAQELIAPTVSSVSRVVPDSPNLSSQNDAQLPALIDGDTSSTWQSLSFAQPQFGGYASNLALVFELEEAADVSEVVVTPAEGTGGAFSVTVGDTPGPEAGTEIGTGTFTGGAVTITADQPVRGQYVTVNFTELPTVTTGSASLPYGLRLAEIAIQ